MVDRQLSKVDGEEEGNERDEGKEEGREGEEREGKR